MNKNLKNLIYTSLISITFSGCEIQKDYLVGKILEAKLQNNNYTLDVNIGDKVYFLKLKGNKNKIKGLISDYSKSDKKVLINFGNFHKWSLPFSSNPIFIYDPILDKSNERVQEVSIENIKY